MAGHPLGQLFSKLHEAFAAPGGTTHRLVIDRRTIEKTWKYMDKVFVKSKVKHNILQFACRKHKLIDIVAKTYYSNHTMLIYPIYLILQFLNNYIFDVLS